MSDAASDAHRQSNENAGIIAPRGYKYQSEESKRQTIEKRVAEGDLRHWVVLEAYYFDIPDENTALYNFIKSVKTMPHPYSRKTVEEIKEQHAVIWNELI